MHYRTAQLLAPEDLGTAGTKVIDIDLDQPISSIEIRFQTTKASSGMSAAAPANISKIEVVDGSRVLHSLNGYENQALGYYNRPSRALDHGQHISTLSEVDIYPIDFGRHLWDEELAFLPRMFNNPQLRITWDEDVADTSVTVNECEVIAKIFDEAQINPIGFLRAVEEYSYTCGAADSYETIKLSEDHVIRQMLVRAYQDGYEPWYQIDEIRFDENNMQRIPFEYTNLENYYRTMKGHWPLIQYPIVISSDTGGLNFYVAPTDYYSGALGIGLGATTEIYFTNAAPRGGKLAITGSANINTLGLASGYLPWHCYQFPLGKPMDIDSWYNPEGKAPRVRLRASTGATSGTGAVILEELERY